MLFFLVTDSARTPRTGLRCFPPRRGTPPASPGTAPSALAARARAHRGRGHHVCARALLRSFPPKMSRHLAKVASEFEDEDDVVQQGAAEIVVACLRSVRRAAER